jgi:hypothetical protein
MNALVFYIVGQLQADLAASTVLRSLPESLREGGVLHLQRCVAVSPPRPVSRTVQSDSPHSDWATLNSLTNSCYLEDDKSPCCQPCHISLP